MLEFARGIVRPAALIMAILATIGFILLGITIPEAWWSLASVMVTYFFMRRENQPNG